MGSDKSKDKHADGDGGEVWPGTPTGQGTVTLDAFSSAGSRSRSPSLLRASVEAAVTPKPTTGV